MSAVSPSTPYTALCASSDQISAFFVEKNEFRSELLAGGAGCSRLNIEEHSLEVGSSASAYACSQKLAGEHSDYYCIMQGEGLHHGLLAKFLQQKKIVKLKVDG